MVAIDAEKRQAKHDIDKEVKTFLLANPTVRFSFKGYPRQCLHAIYARKGLNGIQDILSQIAQATNAKGERNSEALRRHITKKLREFIRTEPCKVADSADVSPRDDLKESDEKSNKSVRSSSSLPPGGASEITESSTASVNTELLGQASEDAACGVPWPEPPAEVLSTTMAKLTTGLPRGHPVEALAVPECKTPGAAGIFLGSAPTYDCEACLYAMLAGMDRHCQQMRPWQQYWVSLVENACRTVIGAEFKKLVLVGSIALSLETPGSDVDLVCLTNSPAQGVDTIDILHKVKDFVMANYQHSGYPEKFHAVVVDDARVPILSLLSGNHVLVDLSVNSQNSLDHIDWFRRVGPAPTSLVSVSDIPVRTATLRLIKWWLRLRRVPRAKSGGLPTIAWMLLVMHSCSEQANTASPGSDNDRRMAQILGLLSSFFQTYTTVSGLDGVLQFEQDSSSSTFHRRDGARKVGQAELTVVDPNSGINLTPPMSPAMHLLLVHELLRARSLLKEASPTGNSIFLQRVFEPVPEFANSLPATITEPFGALVLVEKAADGVCTVELVRISRIHKLPWWNAPFLPRWDRQTTLEAQLLREKWRAGYCSFCGAEAISLSPWNFISRVEMASCEPGCWTLGAEALRCMKSMQALAAEMEGLTQQ
eukprot:TRINITY_DN18041_c0_g1_i1.p1 TRINITY_DN18041_c0_g1~~TRINITY_DN18041_c0_g1_i1.p1  ORF type:complete len:673 (-),score=107.12 TRINITY_DN18041_c0_g1_i1:342-2294(-)